MEKAGPDTLWLKIQPLWPEDRPHLAIGEITDWFASYVYLPKLRDRVVLQGSIRDAVAKLDPQFGYADGFNEATGKYDKLIWAKAPPIQMPTNALLVRSGVALERLRRSDPTGVVGGAAPAIGTGSPGAAPTRVGRRHIRTRRPGPAAAFLRLGRNRHGSASKVVR